jgi:hypothetical protein
MPLPNENENENGVLTPDWGSPPSSPPPLPRRQTHARGPQRIDHILQEAFQSIPGHTYQEKLDELANCDCCDRHKQNKPHMYHRWVDTACDAAQRPIALRMQWNDCACKCRHYARFICRQWPAAYVCADDDEPPPTTDQLAGMIFPNDAVGRDEWR